MRKKQVNLPSMKDYFNAQLEMSEKSQREIAAELGYPNANIMTMFKKGITKIPVSKVGPLAKALNVDPAYMLRIAMNDYMPEVLETIEEIMGDVVTEKERAILKVIREGADGKDVHIATEEQKRQLIEWARNVAEN
ncbi:hypothetical protein [Ectothiorhodospira shaposhnikovii]|uniref:hypothetical protein n=1 Tax=Ectothiorhodospira shaposhnikovii TaxID=1054 RepID=UPI001EE80391|nr:hypothetical protein [Ectothiorhodospira shaposhnikovii]MCG5512774.1 hypothetical protein [Ectothiorhodospira shaposhnikovii]